MTKANRIYDVLRSVLRRDSDCIDELHWDGQGPDRYLELDPFGVIPVDDYHFVLKKTTERDAKILLDDFVCNRTRIGFGLSCQLARLLSEKGQLVSTKMDRMLEKTEWRNYGTPYLLLAYLAVKPDGVEWARKLLDKVPDDWRDGLFLACWKIKDKGLHVKLLRKFEAWLSQDETWGSSDGEGAWLGRFVSKWLTEGTFTYARLEKCIRWHFKYAVL